MVVARRLVPDKWLATSKKIFGWGDSLLELPSQGLLNLRQGHDEDNLSYRNRKL